MQSQIIIALCLGLVKGPPPWLSIDMSQSPHLKQLSQTPSPFSPMCPNLYDTQQTESPCALDDAGDTLMDSAVVQMLVHGPDKQCERGGMCSVKVGSKVKVKVFLSAAPQSLGLSLALCALSASSDPLNNTFIPLLVDECPVAEDVSLMLAPPQSCIKTQPMKSFIFQLGPFYNNSIQFLHCRVGLCRQETKCSSASSVLKFPKCRVAEVPCNPMTVQQSFWRPAFQRTVTQPLLVTISAPYRPSLQSISGQKKPPLLPRHKELPVQGVEMAAVVGLAFCSFFIGALLTVGLWCIHMKTEELDTLLIFFIIEESIKGFIYSVLQTVVAPAPLVTRSS